MVCSNQVREVIGATKYQEKTKSPGGKALEFYPSLRLRFNTPSKMKLEKNIVGTKRERIIGVETKIDVFKSSIWKPFRSADVSIIFDYGIDDIRQNLQYIKDYTDAKAYTLERQPLSNDMKKAIHMIEKDNLEDQLKEQVINLWEEVENQFSTHRKSKRR
jgi:recombination protein RecA